MTMGAQEDPLNSYRGRFGVRFNIRDEHNRARLTGTSILCPNDRAQMLNWGASMEFRFSRNWKFSASRDPVRDCSDPGSQSSTLGYQLGVDLVWEKSY